MFEGLAGLAGLKRIGSDRPNILSATGGGEIVAPEVNAKMSPGSIASVSSSGFRGCVFFPSNHRHMAPLIPKATLLYYEIIHSIITQPKHGFLLQVDISSRFGK